MTRTSCSGTTAHVIDAPSMLVLSQLVDTAPMTLYTCGQAKAGGSLGHPCGRAAKALDDAEHSYELKKTPGYRLMPWTRGGDVRAEIEKLSGQKNLPILVLDDGKVISGSGTVVRWAKANQPVKANPSV